MRGRGTRAALRVGAGVLLLAMLVGVPTAAWVALRHQWPGADQWTRAWRSGRVESDVVVAVGGVVAAVLWAWFAATTVGEFFAVLRGDRGSVDPDARRGWVGRLVRFVVVSTAVVSVSSGVASVGGVSPVRAEAFLPDPLPVQQSGDKASVVPFLSGFGAAVALAGGAVALMGERRRAALRASLVGDRVVVPSFAQVRAEMQLRSAIRTRVVDRVDLAVRSVARHVAALGCDVVAVVSSADSITVVVRGAAGAAPSPWCDQPLSAGRESLVAWRLGSEVPDDYLVAVAGSAVSPCPALVHVGAATAGGGDVFVDVEAVGALWIDSPHGTAIGRHLATLLATTLRPGTGRLFTVGMTSVLAGDAPVQSAESVESALSLATRSSVSVAAEANATNSTTFVLRALGDGEPWEPAVVVSTIGAVEAPVLHGGRGVGLVSPVGEGRWSAPGWYLRATSRGHLLEPLGLRVVPVGLSADDVDVVAELLEASEAPLEHVAPVVPIVAPSAGPEPFVEPAWKVMVRVLGPVQVTSSDGQVADLRRRKALELLVWLTQHRQRPTRAAARAALWEIDVNDATFLNVVSEVRRRLTECAGPVDEGDWIARGAGDLLPLHESVVTDDDIVAARLAASRGLSPSDAVAVLQPAVELIVGMPFSGTEYLWSDAEGVTSAVVIRALAAATELARHQLSLGDLEGVFWSTGQGLKVLPGHEELVALRMRAHARAGDSAGVRHEWSRYLAALAADSWSAAEPSPKLLALRAELLSAGVVSSEALGG